MRAPVARKSAKPIGISEMFELILHEKIIAEIDGVCIESLELRTPRGFRHNEQFFRDRRAGKIVQVLHESENKDCSHHEQS